MDILSPKGSYHIADMSQTIIKIEGFSPGNDTAVIGVDIEKVEKSAIIECLGGFNYVFAFGTDPNSSMYRITFLVFLGHECPTSDGSCTSAGVDKMLGYFNSKKMSTKQLVSVSIGSSVFVGALKSISVLGAQPEINALEMAMTVIGVQD